MRHKIISEKSKTLRQMTQNWDSSIFLKDSLRANTPARSYAVFLNRQRKQ
jgi:hypothetical protein